MRPDADPFTLAGNAGTVATGEDVAGTEAGMAEGRDNYKAIM